MYMHKKCRLRAGTFMYMKRDVYSTLAKSVKEENERRKDTQTHKTKTRRYKHT